MIASFLPPALGLQRVAGGGTNDTVAFAPFAN